MKAAWFSAVVVTLLSSVSSAQVIGGKTPMGTTSAGTSPANTPPCGNDAVHNPPPAQPGGVGIDGGHVWLGEFHGGGLLYKIDAASGAVVTTLSAPDQHIGGVTFANGSLWVSAEQSALIYELDPVSGAVLHTIPSPTASDPDPNGSGLAWDGIALWHADYRANVIYRLSPVSGAILWTIPAPTIGPAGLSYVDGKVLVSSFHNKLLYELDPTNGQVFSRCIAPGQFPWGLAVDASGSTWIADGNTGKIRLAPTAYDVSRYCFGDGSGSTCPCGNTGPTGAGCANSTGLGASLDSDGVPSLTGDTLAFQAVGLVPNQPALLFAGVNAVNAGQGVQFGDGLRCAGGGVVRLGVLAADGSGLASWGPGLLQGGWQAGETRRFQVWYRDPGGAVCGSGFNLSNGSGHLLVP